MAAALSYVSRSLILVLLLATTWDSKRYDLESGGSLYSSPLDLMLKCFVGETQPLDVFHVRTHYYYDLY